MHTITVRAIDFSHSAKQNRFLMLGILLAIYNAFGRRLYSLTID